MAKKGLFVGVGNYRGLATRLDAPAREAQNWSNLLIGYDVFDQVVLPENQATKSAILKAFTKLLKNSKPNDQILFYFGGHGRVVPAHNKEDEYEEAFIAYPEENLEEAEITDTDITDIVANADLAENVDLVFLLDICYAAYFKVTLPPGSKPLYIDSPFFRPLDVSRVREFGSLGGARALTNIQAPLIVAACGRTQMAIETDDETGTPRLLFSWKAVKYLQLDVQHKATFNSLVNDIQPLLEDFDQTPETRGNPSLAMEHFPGDAETETRRTSLPVADAGNRTIATTDDGIIDPIDVHFIGICCFADALRDDDPYKKRVLLPYDSLINPDLKHLPYIEAAGDDLDGYGGPLASWEHTHGGTGVTFRWWNITGYCVEFVQPDTTQPFHVTAAFKQHIPAMYTNVDEQLPYNPNADDCFTSPPKVGVVAAYVDLAHGTLGIGPLENRKTRFKRSKSANFGKFNDRMPKYALLQMPLLTAAATIVLKPYAGGEPSWLRVRPGGSVTIGNARKADIDESGMGEDTNKHYRLYYNLVREADRPDDPRLPVYGAAPVEFCSPTGWP